MPSAELFVPVVFLVFNRPETTARVLARIREARPRQLFVVADGPRAGRTGEEEKCRQVRAIVEEGIDWPCELIRDYSATNLGSAERVSSGITHAFQRFTEAIILEDDCVPDPSFFPFCAELLGRFASEPRIGQIGGTTFRGAAPADGRSYYFSRYPHGWGWATWRRAWRHYDHSLAWAGSAEASRFLSEDGVTAAERRYWRHAFAATLARTVDAWDYRWTASLWARGCLSVLPARNLVENIGFGVGATHTFEGKPPMSGAITFPLQHPTDLVRDAAADAEVAKVWFSRPSVAGRAVRRLLRPFV